MPFSRATASTRLIAPVLSVDATINVDSTADFPASGSIRIRQEIISYASKGPQQFLGCTRALNGTARATYPITDALGKATSVDSDDLNETQKALERRPGIDSSAFPMSFWDDFHYLMGSNNTSFGSEWWTPGTSGSNTIVYPGNETDSCGVVEQTVTAANQNIGLIKGYNFAWEATVGPAYLQAKAKIPVLNDGVNNINWQFGLGNDRAIDSGGTVAIEYDPASTFWRTVAVSGGVRYKLPTTIPVVADRWYILTMTMNSDASVCKFYIDSTLVYTADCSTHDGGCTVVARLNKVLGSLARKVQIDWIAAVLGDKYRLALPNIPFPT